MFFRILAWFTGILAVFLIFVGIFQAVFSHTFIGGGIFAFLGEVLGAAIGSVVVVFIYGAIRFINATLQLAIAEGLQMLMDIEANTSK